MIFVKKIIYILCFAIFVFGLSGCSFFYGNDDTELTQDEIESASKNTVLQSVSGSGVSSIDTILIYTIDDIEGQLVPLKVPVASERVTPELIVNEVLDNIDEKVVVTEIETTKKRIYVSFSEEHVPIKKCSKQFETLILDCISNSLLDNIPYVNKVVFRSEKGAYHSSNFTFGIDEVYSSK